MMGRLYRAFKRRLNWLAERIGGLCDKLLMEVYELPGALRPGAHRLARWLGALCWLVIHFPRLDVYELSGREWTVRFVGSPRGLRELKRLLFADQAVEVRDAGRVALWQLPRAAQGWLRAVDLVVCESGRINPWKPRAPLHICIPTQVTQVLDISGEAEALLAGNARKSLRQRVRKAQKAGFVYRFSRSESDLADFHERIYKPFIQARHGERAALGTLESQRNSWFRRGGLLLIALGDEIVAGTLCYTAGRTVYDIEGGYLHTDPRCAPHGMNALLNWYLIDWARQRGITTYNMGISNAWRSDGPFTFKRRWGARVRRSQMICPDWHLLLDDPPLTLVEHLNAAGLITEVAGQFFSAQIGAPADMPAAQAAAQEAGLAGVIEVRREG